MSTSHSVPLAPSPEGGLIRDLFERRVPHWVCFYTAASFGLLQFTREILVQDFLFSTHYVPLVLWAIPLLLPSVIMVAWFHGKPGPDRDTLARTEKIGVPANLALSGIVLLAIFGDEDLGRMTTSVTVTDAEGEVVEETIVKAEFRKSVALFPFDLGPGIGEGDTWVAYAVPLALELDLLADDFFIARGGFLERNEVFFRDRLAARGFADLRGVPVTFKREVGEEAHAEFLTDGEIDRTGDLYRAELRMYRVDDGSLEGGEIVHEGTDLLALVDELAVSVKRAVGVPVRKGVEDIPVRQRLSDDDEAVEELFRGLEAAFIKADFGAAIELTTAATARDHTFAAAQYILSQYLMLAKGREEAAAPMRAAIDHKYRFPERVSLGVMGDYYDRLGDTERAAAVNRRWVDLSPKDLLALTNYKESLDALGDKEGVLETLEKMRDLDPRNGDLLQEIALVHEELGNDEQALQARTDYVDSFPDDATVYAGLAALQKRLGDYEAARDMLEEATLLEPRSAELAAQLGALELDAGNFADAWASYERALEAARTPEQRAEVLQGIAKYHLRRGEVVLAVEATEKLLEEASNHASPLEGSNVLASFLFDILFDAGQVNDVLAVVEAVDDPNMAQLVMMFTMVGSAGPEAVRQVFERVKGEIRNPLLYHHRDLGRTLRLAGQLDESEAELTEALRLFPGDPKAHFEMALLLEARGNLDGAVEHLGNALAAWENADDDYEPARQARAKLEELRGR